jgi:hypothetical protein
VDTLAMADMALPAGDRPVSLTYLVVTYLVVEVQVWLSNPLPRIRALSEDRAGIRLPAARRW